MEKLKAIIVDDEADAREVLASLLIDTHKINIVAQISESHKVESAINRLNPDVLFLDISMPKVDGLELLQTIREYNHTLQVVYVTAFDKYMERAIKLNVFSYLLKPVNRAELMQLVDNLSKSVHNKPRILDIPKLKLPIPDGYVYLKPRDIFLMQADANYTNIRTVNGDTVMSSYNMGKLSKRLPSGMFLRVNRGVILNGEYLFKINKKEGLCIAKLGNEEVQLKASQKFITCFNKTLA